MSTSTRKTLTLSRDGGGTLKIHAREWPALVQAVTEALQLNADPAVALEDLPARKRSAASPVSDSRRLVAEYSALSVDRPLAGHHRENFGVD